MNKRKNHNSIETYRSRDRRWAIHHGDVEQVLQTLPSCTYDGVLTDPPYGIGFMGHHWDGVVPPVEIWRELLRACKPGAHLLAFGSPKTFHRLFCSIEDAGWEFRDCFTWLKQPNNSYSHNIGNDVKKIDNTATEWEGYGTHVKPAWEPIVIAQKPTKLNLAENALKRGCAGLNLESCRTSVENGRLPTNALLDGYTAALVDRQGGYTRSRRSTRRKIGRTIYKGRTRSPMKSHRDEIGGYDDEGGVSRFFYCAPVSGESLGADDHPALKPVALCQYLARLILQPRRKTPRRLIVPFSGSGSEMLAGLLAGWDHVTGIELDGEYIKTAKRRLSASDALPDSA